MIVYLKMYAHIIWRMYAHIIWRISFTIINYLFFERYIHDGNDENICVLYFIMNAIFYQHAHTYIKKNDWRVSYTNSRSGL